jgi:hypothetical protein
LAEAEEAIGIWRAIREAIWECELDVTSKMVALRMVEHLPNIEMSVIGVAEKTGLTERAVQKALRRLEGYRVIITLPMPGRKSRYVFSGQPHPRTTFTGDNVTPEPRSPLTPEPRSPEAVNLKADQEYIQPAAVRASRFNKNWEPSRDAKTIKLESQVRDLERVRDDFHDWATGTPRKYLDWSSPWRGALKRAIAAQSSAPAVSKTFQVEDIA